jgi:hypothetical protein
LSRKRRTTPSDAIGFVFCSIAAVQPAVPALASWNNGNPWAHFDLSFLAMPEPNPKRIASWIIESISEEPKIEPGQADNTPGSESKTQSKESRFEDEPACPDKS